MNSLKLSSVAKKRNNKIDFGSIKIELDSILK